METREELFESLESLFIRYFEANSARKEVEIKDMIYNALESAKEIDFNFDLKKNQTFS